MKTYIIGEAAGTWLHGGLDAAKRSIHLAASCGASAWKTQWTSDHLAMHKRRGIAGDHYKRLQWDINYHKELSEACQKEGIDYLCTVFLPQDIPIIAPYVAKFKVSAFEAYDDELLEAYGDHAKRLIVSLNPEGRDKFERPDKTQVLHCVSKYPTQLEEIRVNLIGVPIVLKSSAGMSVSKFYQGLSDHTTSVLTGAVAVGAGATILEKHVMTHDTPHDDPDYGHSLILDTENKEFSFRQYVQNVRDAERMMYGSSL